MKYPFRPIIREIYPKTFLKDVRLTAQFSPVDFSKVNKEQVKDYFHQFRGVEFDIENLKGGLELKSNDEKVRLRFSLSDVEVVLRQPFYKRYEQAESFFMAIAKYLEAITVSDLKKLSISKYNELRFQQSSADFPILTIMEGVFSKELLSFVKADKETFKDMVRWEKAVTIDGTDETGTLFSAECGFNKSEPNSLYGRLTLTTRVESVKPISLINLLDEARVYNQILDNAFHWCITKEIIEKMKSNE